MNDSDSSEVFDQAEIAKFSVTGNISMDSKFKNQKASILKKTSKVNPKYLKNKAPPKSSETPQNQLYPNPKISKATTSSRTFREK